MASPNATSSTISTSGHGFGSLIMAEVAMPHMVRMNPQANKTRSPRLQTHRHRQWRHLAEISEASGRRFLSSHSVCFRAKRLPKNVQLKT